MKFNIKKPIIISSLLALGFGATAVGTTFALFTDKAETKIQVQAGIVDLDYQIKLVKYENEEGLTNEAKTFEEGKTEYTTETNTEIKLANRDVTIKNMIPGDKLTLNVKVVNKSNVKTKWRLSAATMTGDLAPALTVAFSKDATTWTPAEPATNLTEGTPLYDGTVTIAFPNHDDGILVNTQGTDNQYQDKSATIKFAAEMVQGNANV